ncbi:MAG: hypothetical protein F6K23_11785 [Okeania sp. SIO2C9]|uniref:hypothetical protein n=1 Tax=Okeania sp. SIO2C9 TaxID=2607791 RepID=UPI0013C15FF4|nr:hypothetical protein [Okeania sp. SIO2C9]NEQ73671.1 hypothetical protein [Okeania sp. SIO2C9]
MIILYRAIARLTSSKFPPLQPFSDREIKSSGEGSLNVPQKVSFSRTSGGGLRHYYINGEPYDPESQDYVLELNTAEQWVLSNPSESPQSNSPNYGEELSFSF